MFPTEDRTKFTVFQDGESTCSKAPVTSGLTDRQLLFRGCPNEIAKLSCDADAGVVDGFALVKAQQKWDRSMSRTIRNGKHWPVQHIWMAKMEPTAWLDALPQEYGSLGRDPFKDGPHKFLVKFHLSVDCSQWTRLYPDTTLIGLRVFDWSTSYDNPEYHCMMYGYFLAIQRRILERDGQTYQRI
ncbi:hypothetical protein IV203_009522 [Nitzschia inconspicua]|uniref:Uncharacterized protein n=1 Tax=Nitzschia inconspicua TaxID=303405 RepID=A0A9K3KUU1_9STRA|nr:hypothetical protein IV203_009522 [Nitzschia inconspicua]